MAEDEPLYQPPVDAPADTTTDTITMTPEQELAFERGKNAGLEAALARQPQPSVTAPAAITPEAPLPTNPLDLLSATEREKLKLKRAVDPEGYEEDIIQLSGRLTEMRIARQAAPIIAGQAHSIIAAFRSRMAYEDPAYFKDIAPIFDAQINALGDGVRGLVNMNSTQQDAELSMRWKSAKADIMDRQMAEAKRKAKLEPPPLRGDGFIAPAGPTAAEELDPVIATLHARHNFDADQLAALNAQYKKDMAS